MPNSNNYSVSSLTGWHHIAAVANGGITTFYVDGEAKGTVAAQITTNIDTVGNQRTGDTRIGGVDDVAIFNSAFSDGQVLAASTSTLTGKETGLLTCYTFNGGTTDITNLGGKMYNNAELLTKNNGYIDTVSNNSYLGIPAIAIGSSSRTMMGRVYLPSTGTLASSGSDYSFLFSTANFDANGNPIDANSHIAFKNPTKQLGVYFNGTF